MLLALDTGNGYSGRDYRDKILVDITPGVPLYHTQQKQGIYGLICHLVLLGRAPVDGYGIEYTIQYTSCKSKYATCRLCRSEAETEI
jgi:hypothetical protein